MLWKTLVGVVLTGVAIVGVRPARMAVGLSPKSFGINSSLWGMTSFASGTGELALLAHAGSQSVLGSYRVSQSIASLGSIIGFAALAPLLRRSTLGRGVRREMKILATVAILAVGPPFLVQVVLAPSGDRAWLGFVACVLASAAVINVASVPPLTTVSRSVGSRYSLRIGVATAFTYWLLIVGLGVLGAYLFCAAPSVDRSDCWADWEPCGLGSVQEGRTS